MPMPQFTSRCTEPPPCFATLCEKYTGGTDHFMFTGKEKSSHKAIFRWVAVLLSLVGSLSCLSFGVSLYCRALENPRADAVGKYNKAVQSWAEAERQPFDSLSVHLRILNTTHQLVPDGEEDMLRDPVTQDLSPFRPLRYSRYGPLFRGMQWDAEHGEYRTDLQLILHDKSTGANSVVDINQILFYKTLIHRRKNQKTCLYQTRGYWNLDRMHCETYERVDELCFLVEREGGVWRLATESDHSGCFGAGIAKGPQHFVQVSGATQGFGTGSPPNGPVDFDQLHTTVRSIHDPTLAAAKITHGTLRFGSTQRDDFMQGFMFGALGILLGLPMAGMCMITLNEPKDEYKEERALQESGHETKSGFEKFWSSLSQKISATASVSDDFEGL